MAYYQDPLEILQHLMIGSEETLSFISEITFRTIPDPAYEDTALILFPNIVSACSVVTELKEQKIYIVEMFERSILKAIEDQPTNPKHLKDLNDSACALLIKTGTQQETVKDSKVFKLVKFLSLKGMLAVTVFTPDSTENAEIWWLRKILLPSVRNLKKVC